MKYIVYLTTNLKSSINGRNRIYIGVHKIENPDIKDDYLGCGVKYNTPSTYMFPKTPFQYAVKKYGPQAFNRVTLFIFDTAEEAYKKESEIVNEDFIKRSDTYNVALGGIGGSLYKQDPKWHTKSINQFDLQGNLVHKWESSIDVCEFYGFDIQKLQWACIDCYKFFGFYWSRNKSIDIKKYKSEHKKYTYLYNSDGKFLTEFESRTECANFLNCCPQSISNALRNQKSIKNYYVSDKLVDLFIPKARKQLQNEIIYLYDVNNNFIGKFKGKEIMPVIGTYSYSTINKAFNDNKGWYKDFYLSLNEITKVPSKKVTKSIDIYTLDGHYIETLNSLKEVKEKYNVNSAELNRILKGIKTGKNYIFKYNK